MSILLGSVDQGTTSTRFILFKVTSNAELKVVAVSQWEIESIHQQPGYQLILQPDIYLKCPCSIHIDIMKYHFYSYDILPIAPIFKNFHISNIPTFIFQMVRTRSHHDNGFHQALHRRLSQASPRRLQSIHDQSHWNHKSTWNNCGLGSHYWKTFV